VLVLSTFCYNFNVLLPLVAERTLSAGAGTFGLIAAIFGAGALVGAITNAVRGQASLRLLLIGATGYGIFELVLAPLSSIEAVCACLFLVGCFYTLWGTNALAAIQLEAPEHLRGRAASLYFFAFLGGAPLGGLFAGWLVSIGGTQVAFYVAGAVALLTAAAGITRLATAGAGQKLTLRARQAR
jgi:MFS family permease